MKPEQKIAKKPTHPCKKDCPDRTAGCAITCIQWKIYEELREEFYASKLKLAESRNETSAAMKMYPNS